MVYEAGQQEKYIHGEQMCAHGVNGFRYVLAQVWSYASKHRTGQSMVEGTKCLQWVRCRLLSLWVGGCYFRRGKNIQRLLVVWVVRNVYMIWYSTIAVPYTYLDSVTAEHSLKQVRRFGKPVESVATVDDKYSCFQLVDRRAGHLTSAHSIRHLQKGDGNS